MQLQGETVQHGVAQGRHHVLVELVLHVGVLSWSGQRGQEGVYGSEGSGHPSLQLLVSWQVSGRGLGSGDRLGGWFVSGV